MISIFGNSKYVYLDNLVDHQKDTMGSFDDNSSTYCSLSRPICLLNVTLLVVTKKLLGGGGSYIDLKGKGAIF